MFKIFQHSPAPVRKHPVRFLSPTPTFAGRTHLPAVREGTPVGLLSPTPTAFAGRTHLLMTVGAYEAQSNPEYVPGAFNNLD